MPRTNLPGQRLAGGRGVELLDGLKVRSWNYRVLQRYDGCDMRREASLIVLLAMDPGAGSAGACFLGTQ